MKALGIKVGSRYRTVEEARIIEVLLLYGWAFEVRAGRRAPAEREAAEALDRWVGLGLPFERSNDGKRYFDPAEVVNFLKWAAIHDGDPCWEERFIATGRRLVSELHPGETTRSMPPSPIVLGPQRFSVTLRREFNLEGCRPGAPVRLRLPLPLEDDALSDLKVVSIPPPGIAVEFAVAPGRLDARLPVPRQGSVTLGVQARFTAYPTVPGRQLAPLPPSEIELYTRPGEGVVQVSPRVRALAAELAGTAREPWAAVQCCWNFILDRLTCGVVHYDQLDGVPPTDWVLETGWFDCQLGSALLVALCRAKAIPARIVGGYLLYPPSPSPHFWAEAWVAGRGWVPLDTLCSDLSARGRDRPWRDYFAGQLDYRMKTQCFPRIFNSSPTIRLPPAWHLLARPEGEGAEIGFFNNDTGSLVYRDRISVRREDGPAAGSP